MATQWFYRLMGEQVGPVSGEKLRALQQSGRISDDTWVKRGVDGAWILAGSIFGPAASGTIPAQDRQFDPYHRWLGIPPKHQPPNHYRLLAIEPFEDDPEVIRDAAERQMAHVRSYALGRYADLSQRVLNELGGARACLLDPDTKAAYDQQLRRGLQEKPVHNGAGGGGVGSHPSGLTEAAIAPGWLAGRSLTAGPSSRKKAILAGSLGVAVLVVVGMVWGVVSQTRPAPGTARRDDTPTEPNRPTSARDIQPAVVQPRTERVAPLPKPTPAAPAETEKWWEKYPIVKAPEPGAPRVDAGDAWWKDAPIVSPGQVVPEGKKGVKAIQLRLDKAITTTEGDKLREEVQECLNLLRLLPDTERNSSAYWTAVSRCYFFLDSFELARDAGQKAIEHDSADLDGYSSLIQSCTVLGDYEAALEFSRRAAAVDPKQAWPYTEMGDAFLDLGKPEQAILAFKSALRCGQSSKWAYAVLRLGDTYVKIGKETDAIRLYESVMQELGPDARFSEVLAKKLERLRRLKTLTRDRR